jgi:hypothetical protein
VEVNFVDPLSRKSFRAKGKATAHGRDTDTYRASRGRFDRWNALAKRINHIVLIEVHSASHLSSPVYDDGESEADLRAKWTFILIAE